MGIPINGTITSFHSKLLKKGFRTSEINSYVPVGARVYDGRFAGKEVQVCVFYNEISKIVWKCRVVIDCDDSKSRASSELDYFKDLLKEKYEGQALDSDMLKEEGDTTEFFSLFVFEPPIQEGSYMMGIIGLYIHDFEDV